MINPLSIFNRLSYFISPAALFCAIKESQWIRRIIVVFNIYSDLWMIPHLYIEIVLQLTIAVQFPIKKTMQKQAGCLFNLEKPAKYHPGANIHRKPRNDLFGFLPLQPVGESLMTSSSGVSLRWLLTE